MADWRSCGLISGRDLDDPRPAEVKVAPEHFRQARRTEAPPISRGIARGCGRSDKEGAGLRTVPVGASGDLWPAGAALEGGGVGNRSTRRRGANRAPQATATTRVPIPPRTTDPVVPNSWPRGAGLEAAKLGGGANEDVLDGEDPAAQSGAAWPTGPVWNE